MVPELETRTANALTLLGDLEPGRRPGIRMLSGELPYPRSPLRTRGRRMLRTVPLAIHSWNKELRAERAAILLPVAALHMRANRAGARFRHSYPTT
jgi:hypothetical protein